MKTNTHPGFNGLQTANSSTASGSQGGVVLTGILAHFLADPQTAEEMRQNVRTWFLSGLEDWESRAGTNLRTQTDHFAALDDFLAASAARPTI